MKYFAYGSNMSLNRLRRRVPGAQSLGSFSLEKHELRFHKFSIADGSGKCDVYYTGDRSSLVLGVLYEIDESEKAGLDRAEGLGYGYDEKEVSVLNAQGESVRAHTYYATEIDDTLRPFTWYKQHVVTGAKEANLSEEYISRIEEVEAVSDYDYEREASQLAIHY